MWLNGPAFLWKHEAEWEEECNIPEIGDDNYEVKVCIKSNVITPIHDDNDLLSTLEERISRWPKITRVLGVMMKFCRKCQKIETSHSDFVLSTVDVRVAEVQLVRMIQARDLKDEVAFYKSSKEPLPKRQRRNTGRLWRLDPYIDTDGLLRVGGRMRKSLCEEVDKHPIILPKIGVAVQRLVEHIHRSTKHGGRLSTTNSLRSSGYWVIYGNACVRRTIFHCVKCRQYRGKLGEQKMADLPEERTLVTAPFTHCGIDMFGPFHIKVRRTMETRFVALFTCFSSRAIHLEPTTDLTADTFIMALRRFLARRGPTESIRSDNGKNFIGAENQFKHAYNQMDHNKINNFLVTQSCDWIRWEKNPPEASHMGGVWERQIRTVRKVLMGLLNENSTTLNNESFCTLLTEAEVIVNSRPLTSDLDDPTMQALSPHQLLTMKTKLVLPPPGIFQKADIYCKRRWRHVQHLANEFWSRWRKEYLQEIQQRTKWTASKRNFRVDDIVLMKDSNVSRQQWPMARIVKVYPDANDGLVRTVDLKVTTAKSIMKRPIQKIVLLLEGTDE